MEADWEAQIGEDLPVIDAQWEGFIDLRSDPAAIPAVPEAVRYPAMARALAILNGGDSPFFTTKSDVWSLGEDEIDPYEFGAEDGSAKTGIGSYIDVVQIEEESFVSYPWHEQQARNLIAALRGVDVSNSRVDMVIRAARAGDREGYGFTLYAAGCGSDESSALANWESVLNAAVAATMKTAG